MFCHREPLSRKPFCRPRLRRRNCVPLRWTWKVLLCSACRPYVLRNLRRRPFFCRLQSFLRRVQSRCRACRGMSDGMRRRDSPRARTTDHTSPSSPVRTILHTSLPTDRTTDPMRSRSPSPIRSTRGRTIRSTMDRTIPSGAMRVRRLPSNASPSRNSSCGSRSRDTSRRS